MQAIYVCFLNFILASKRCKMIWKEFDTMAYINYNYAVLKMKSSLLFIIIVLSWRLAKQFLAQIFSIRKTKKVSHYPLKLPSQDVTGEIRINLLSAWQKFVFRWIKYEITVEMKSILRNEKEVKETLSFLYSKGFTKLCNTWWRSWCGVNPLVSK